MESEPISIICPTLKLAYNIICLVFLATVCGPVHTAKTSIDQIPLADECRFYITADV